MKATFKCSEIRNVFLRRLDSCVELEINYIKGDGQFLARKSLNKDISNRIDDFSYAYEDISDALIEGKDFVRIELKTVGD